MTINFLIGVAIILFFLLFILSFTSLDFPQAFIISIVGVVFGATLIYITYHSILFLYKTFLESSFPDFSHFLLFVIIAYWTWKILIRGTKKLTFYNRKRR